MKKYSVLTRIAAVTLAVLMILPMVCHAASFTDIAGHWSVSYVDYMSDKSILNGYPDGSFQPDGIVTRAEFIKMLDETFGLTLTRAIPYNDVSPSEWYYTYVSKATAQGYLLEYGARLNPDGQLTREEAAALLVRYLDLPADELVSTSYYPDFASINSNYRTYVLQATKAGLFQGYTDGTFKPKNTLTRAEALKILYCAAGTIYDASAVGVDSRAYNRNAVIKESNITVKNASRKGTVILSEGVTSGTVTLYSCDFDHLVIRGTGKLILSDCSIDKLTVKTNSTTPSSITLEDGTVINEADLVSPAAFNTQKVSDEIKTLTVGDKANGSSFSGTGKLGKAEINGARFVSTVVPSDYTIGKDLSATFAGTTYSGSAADFTGFNGTPTVKNDASSGYDTITYKAVTTGTLYYYYSNTATAPTSTQFQSYYNTTAGGAKGYVAIDDSSVNKDTSIRGAMTSTASGYAYLVLCIKNAGGAYCKPVVLNRAGSASSSGFTSQPVASTVSGIDYLVCTPMYAGMLYFYYTNSATAPTASNFATYYNAASMKSQYSVAAGTQVNQQLAQQTAASAYAYVAVMLVGNNGTTTGTNYTPVLITRNANDSSASNSGFKNAPSITRNANGYDYMSFATTASGTLYYYYSATSTNPGTAGFDAAYSAALKRSAVTVSSSQTYSNTIMAESYDAPIASYPYIIFMLKPSSGTTTYPPYVYSRSSSSANTGFSSAPTVTAGTSSDTITFTPGITGMIYLYYTNSAVTPTSSEFMTTYNNYQSSGSSNYLFGQMSVTAGQSSTSQYTHAAVNSYNYIVFMLRETTLSQQAYTPVVVARKASTSSSATCFNVASVNVTTTYDTLTLATTAAGTVYYYYTNVSSAPTSASFLTNYSAALYKSTVSISAASTVGTTYTTSVPSSSATSGGYTYIALMYVSTTSISYQPILIRRTASGSSSGSVSPSSTGFSVAPKVTMFTEYQQDSLTFTSAINGTLYYYYADSSVTKAPTSTEFMTGYSAAAYHGTKKVTAGTNVDFSIVIKDTTQQNKGKVVVMLWDNNNQLYVPVLVSRTSASN